MFTPEEDDEAGGIFASLADNNFGSGMRNSIPIDPSFSWMRREFQRGLILEGVLPK
jgi:hypothetical protein